MNFSLVLNLLLLLCLSIEAKAQNTQYYPIFNKLKPEEQVIVLTWLNNTCNVGEEHILKNKIIALSSYLDPVFWEAYQLGPTEQDIKKLRTTAISNYMERNEWLQIFGDEQMGKEETKRQLAITEDQYVGRVIDDYTIGYKTSAISGVGLIGKTQWQNELNQIANDPKNPAQTAAQEVLKKLLVKSSVNQKRR